MLMLTSSDYDIDKVVNIYFIYLYRVIIYKNNRSFFCRNNMDVYFNEMCFNV